MSEQSLNMNHSTCRRCLYRNDHPLGLVIDNEGICSGCRIHEEKDTLDWSARWEELEKLVAPYRTRDSRNYDCIVPVTGAGDSYFIVHTVINRLRLKPLLVTYNRYYNTPIGIRNLANLRRQFDADILIQNVNPNSVKAIIKTTLRKLGSFQWPAIAGQTVFPVQTAVSYRIPLIIWGAHQDLEQVGMYSHLHNVEMTRRYRKDHDLQGLEADDLLSNFDSLREEDIWQYRYPAFEAINNIGIKGIYLGNYIRWDPLAQHLEMVRRYNYKSAKQNRTFDTYDNIDDWHYADTHDLIKYAKHGYGKVVDHACREIRHGRISRRAASYLSYKYLDKSTENSNLLLEWLGIDANSLNFIVSQQRQGTNYKFNLEAKDPDDHNTAMSLFKQSNLLSLGGNKRHIVIGKGYPDP